MTLEHLQFEDWVPFPLARVFQFFANPLNLPRLMPPASATRIDSLDIVPPADLASGATDVPAAGVGTVIKTSFRPVPFLPFRARWVARITEFDWNRHFADVQEEGPFRQWRHRHEFVAESKNGADGTVVRDVIDYEVGFGPLGTAANRLFIERQMRRTFAQRQKILPELLS